MQVLRYTLINNSNWVHLMKQIWHGLIFLMSHIFSKRGLWVMFGVFSLVLGSFFPASSFAHQVQVDQVQVDQVPPRQFSLGIRMSPERLIAQQNALKMVQDRRQLRSVPGGMAPLTVVKQGAKSIASLVSGVSFVAGLMLVFALSMQVQTYRNNPRAVMPSQLVMTGICAVLLFGVSYIPSQRLPSPPKVQKVEQMVLDKFTS